MKEIIVIGGGLAGTEAALQIAERKITKPEEELKVNQHVNAKVLQVDKENKKIELSIKELEGTAEEYKEEM